MKGFVPDFHLEVPADLDHCLNLMNQDPDRWKPFAGGTDLMVLFESGKLKHKNFLDISRFEQFQGIQTGETFLKIGSLANYRQIQAHPEIQKRFPNLIQCAHLTGAKAIQNRGTLGGNIANASPAADTPPALLAYEAEIEMISVKGKRRIAYSEFHQDYKKFNLQRQELISAIYLPLESQWTHHYYRKVGTRSFQSISKIALAGTACIDNGVIRKIRAGVASVAAFPLRLYDLEKLEGKSIKELNFHEISEQISAGISPLDDIRSTKVYRSKVTAQVVEEFLNYVSKNI